ncbi:uncharacterized protein LOC105444316 [Strongylocentrotus purpuratus]|uniref:Ubiquitin-like domain-containing protein n=1 Tax=Strongylocentrotus purpuratus TaxID=7668 RepID=A0A7M7NN37_STRPU|nr:uncharacterized protein LOC105444316 [Strongylocentrotus purpuratus]
MSSTYGNTGNEGQRGYDDGNGDVNTYSNRGNEPSRHRDVIDLLVNPGKGKQLTMQADINWTLDKLHRSSAERCGMSHSQCYSTCASKPVSGSSTVREAGIRNGYTVNLNARLRGG